MSMKKLILLLTLCVFSCKEKDTRTAETTVNSNPNIILFYVDDLGYGDVGIYGAKGVQTPHIDSLARNGLKFNDAHCSAATCTPSRYSLLTGNYGFRNNAAVLPGNAPLIIDTTQQTLPGMLKKAGYRTGVVGKWHLGLGIGAVNWNKRISPGANEVGFDYSFLLPATGDRVPTVFVENGFVINSDPIDPIKISYDDKIGDRPTGLEHPEMLKVKADTQHSNTIINGVSRIGYMAGGKKAEWVDEEFPFVFNSKAKDFINKDSDKPFFLYYSFHDIHVPRMPNERFQGKSSMGPRGDAIVQVDFVVGEIMKELKEKSLEKNTLVIFTSDNGPVLDDGYSDHAEELVDQHKPAGPLRGGKYSIYEGGTRVPTIVFWPDKVKKGESDALINQVDLLASLARLVDVPISTEVVDSKDQLDAWLGKTKEGRQEMLEEAFTFAFREGNWKYIKPLKSNDNVPDWMINKDIEGGLSVEPQLYDLDNDPGEQNNLAKQHPEIVKEYEQALMKIINKEDS